MSKLSRKTRVNLIHRIEDTLAAYCRHCPNDINAVTRLQCEKCPIGGELREIGQVLKGTTPPKVPIKYRTSWTDEEDAQIWELRALGETYQSIGDILGRTRQLTHARAMRIGEAKPKSKKKTGALK